MEAKSLETAQQQQPATLAAYQQAFPWMEAPTFVEISQEDEDDAAA
jgi:hypothetical protein